MTHRDDPHGTVREEYGSEERRFKIRVDGHEPDEEPGWRYKLRVVDQKYNDSDSYPIEAVAGGDSWQEAFARAIHMVEQALATNHCIF